MRKTVFALLLTLPMLAACPGTTPSQPGSTPSTTPSSTTTPVVSPSGAPGAGSVATGAVTADATVKYEGFVFTPNSVTIKAGQSVAFQNPATSQSVLRVIANDGSWDSGSINPGTSFIQKYSKAGTFTYKHQLQTSATGTVVVQ